MNRLLILAPALLLALPAVAQDAPQAGYQNLWCHFAFATTATQIPALPEDQLAAAHAAGDAATPEQLELLAAEVQIKQIVDGIPALLETATAGYTEAGFTTEQFDAAKAALDPKVVGQVMGSSGEPPEFAFEQCLALLPAPAETTTQ
jgi:hypothetical protein